MKKVIKRLKSRPRLLQKIEIVIGVVLLLVVIVGFILTLGFYLREMPNMKDYTSDMYMKEMQTRNASDSGQFLQANVEMSVFTINYVMINFSMLFFMLLEAIMIILLVSFTFRALEKYVEKK